MEPLITSLSSLGGMGLLSGALLLLHREAIRAFRKELAAERELFRGEMTQERRLCEERHEEIMDALRLLKT